MSSTYICAGSGKMCEGKPWITIQSERWDNVQGPVTFSSYLDYRHNLDKIPANHFHLIVNKEDFNEPRPQVYNSSTEPNFTFLTETEINQLSDEQYQQYKLDYEEASMFQGTRTQVHEEGLINDIYTKYIENEFDTSEDSSSIDDY